MVNLIEVLFAVAAVSIVIALVLYSKRRTAPARRFAVGGGVSGIVAAALELYLRM